MNKLNNNVTLIGPIYEAKIEKKVTGENSKKPGTTYLTGTLSVATNNECTNIVPIHYSYVAPIFPKSGKPNRNYEILEGILDGKYKTIMRDGLENATVISVSSSLALNEFYSDRSGQNELVSVKRTEGGFINVITTLPEKEEQRNKFDCAMIITNMRTIEPDEEKNTPEKGVIKGAIFDYNGALLPVEFTVLHPDAINYFESCEISNKNPLFIRVQGKQVSEVVKKELRQKSVFGEDFVREVTNTKKDFIITGAQEPYEFDEEVAEMLKTAVAKRETYLATLKQQDLARKEAAVAVKQDNDEYKF